MMIVNAIDIMAHRDFWLALGFYASYYVTRMYFFEMCWRAGAVAANFRGPGLISQLGLAAVLTVLILAMTPLLLGLAEHFNVDYLRLFTLAQLLTIAAICALFTVSMMATEGFGLFSGLTALFQACAVLALAASTLSRDRADLMPDWRIGLTIAAAGLIVTLIPGLGLIAVTAGGDGQRRRIAVGITKTISALLAILPLTLYAGWMRVANGL
jgi:hypothetical protein